MYVYTTTHLNLRGRKMALKSLLREAPEGPGPSFRIGRFKNRPGGEAREVSQNLNISKCRLQNCKISNLTIPEPSILFTSKCPPPPPAPEVSMTQQNLPLLIDYNKRGSVMVPYEDAAFSNTH